MELQIEEQRQLIEKFVRTNAKYEGNEDLFEDFCNEAYQKSYIIFNSPTASIQRVESYVQKVVNTSMIVVLKDLGRLKRTSKGYIKNNEIPLEENKPVNSSSVKNIKSEENITDSKTVYTYEIEDPKLSIEEEVITKDLLQRIADTVCIIHSENPKKSYVELFQYRYIQGLKQNQISEVLKLSQAEVSKRLIELSKQIKARIR